MTNIELCDLLVQESWYGISISEFIRWETPTARPPMLYKPTEIEWLAEDLKSEASYHNHQRIVQDHYSIYISDLGPDYMFVNQPSNEFWL